MRHSNQSGSLDLVGSGKKFIIIFWHAGNTGFFQHIRIRPDPVNAVDVDRHRDVAALVFHAVRDDLGQQRVPLLGLGSGIEISKHALTGPLLNRRAFDLRGRRRIAGNHAAFQHRGSGITAAARHGKVFPHMAFGLHDFLQLDD